MSLAAMTLVLAAQGMALVSGPMIGFDTQVPHKRIRSTAEQIAADEAAKAKANETRLNITVFVNLSSF